MGSFIQQQQGATDEEEIQGGNGPHPVGKLVPHGQLLPKKELIQTKASAEQEFDELEYSYQGHGQGAPLRAAAPLTSLVVS